MDGVLYVIGGEFEPSGVARQGVYQDTVWAYDPRRASATTSEAWTPRRGDAHRPLGDGRGRGGGQGLRRRGAPPAGARLRRLRPGGGRLDGPPGPPHAAQPPGGGGHRGEGLRRRGALRGRRGQRDDGGLRGLRPGDQRLDGPAPAPGPPGRAQRRRRRRVPVRLRRGGERRRPAGRLRGRGRLRPPGRGLALPGPPPGEGARGDRGPGAGGPDPPRRGGHLPGGSSGSTMHQVFRPGGACG